MDRRKLSRRLSDNPARARLATPVVQQARVNITPARHGTHAASWLLRLRDNPKLLFKPQRRRRALPFVHERRL